ncbi:MAG: zf-HC2 domain-containing protein [Acidobacteriota bacterium]
MNDVNFAKCKFSSGIVPYMYGEMPGPESSSFESHLLDCSPCTDEFAMISSARYEVYEWKKLEFDPLATPQIEIVFEAEPAAGVSWLDKFRASFAQGWAIPSMAAAGIFVAAIFAAAFIFSENGSPDVAANFAKDVVVDEPGVQSAPKVTATDSTVSADASGDREREPRVIRPATPQRVSQKRVVTAVKSVDVKATSAQNERKAPTLNEFVEEEDTSVRLAELFADIETSE